MRLAKGDLKCLPKDKSSALGLVTSKRCCNIQIEAISDLLHSLRLASTEECDSVILVLSRIDKFKGLRPTAHHRPAWTMLSGQGCEDYNHSRIAGVTISIDPL